MDILLEQWPEGWTARVIGKDNTKTRFMPDEFSALGLLINAHHRKFGILSILMQRSFTGLFEEKDDTEG